MDLMPFGALEQIAWVFTFGAKKYAPHNWRNGFEWSRLIAALERHIGAFKEGEDTDPESQMPHLAHAGCCLLMLLEHTLKGYGMDDRYSTLMKKDLNVEPKSDKIVFQSEETKWQQDIAKNYWWKQPYTVSAITLVTTVPKVYGPSMKSSMMKEAEMILGSTPQSPPGSLSPTKHSQSQRSESCIHNESRALCSFCSDDVTCWTRQYEKSN